MSESLFDAGMKIRREVLGDAYVDASLAKASGFSEEMQQLVTEYCWGTVWGRPGIDHKTRSIVNIAMLTALNRNHELATHVRGAINNGVTPDEIKEVLLQATIYCGVPAGLESFRVAREVLETMEAETKQA